MVRRSAVKVSNVDSLTPGKFVWIAGDMYQITAGTGATFWIRPSLRQTVAAGQRLDGSGVVSTVVAGVVQFAFSRGQGQTRQPAPGAQQVSFKDPIAPRFFYHGRVRRGAPGGAIFYETTASNGQGDLWRILVTDCDETTEIEKRYLENMVVTVPSGGGAGHATCKKRHLWMLTMRLNGSCIGLALHDPYRLAQEQMSAPKS